ncbi:hypothetical protein MLD38_025651 [Melastoma candidum]|uniref:Uncharacterized protein n=1 Tax=Melastoma candidum TaxID=119954 RepID=A0ACB9NXL2_9MYRT|nr:hypothetical protein MLD38_025651 [Melastoma candidum]
MGQSGKANLTSYMCIACFFIREFEVVGIFRYKNTWPLCIELIGTGKIDTKPLINHRPGFTHGEVERAFETSVRGGKAFKVMFNLLAGSRKPHERGKKPLLLTI